MTYLATLPAFILLQICFLGGLLIGYGYFRALRETAHLLVKGGAPLRAIALTVGRISVLTMAFYIAVLLGGVALLATFAGVLCAKWIMLREIQRVRT